LKEKFFVILTGRNFGVVNIQATDNLRMVEAYENFDRGR
jgi:hypothetical protein